MSHEVTLKKMNASILANGTICPVCEYADEGEEFNYDSEGLMDTVECNMCGSSWTSLLTHVAIHTIRLPGGNLAILPEGQMFLQRENDRGFPDKSANYVEATANIRLILEYFKNPSMASAKEVAKAVASLNRIMPSVE